MEIIEKNLFVGAEWFDKFSSLDNNILLKSIDYYSEDFNNQGINRYNVFMGYNDRTIYSKFIYKIKEYVDANKVYLIEDGFKIGSDEEDFYKSEMLFLAEIKKEFQKIDINSIDKENIILFEDNNLNKLYLKALANFISAIKCNFTNDAIFLNFIVKVVYWSCKYIANSNFTYIGKEELIFIGDISLHEVFFLDFLYTLGFNITYINFSLEDKSNILFYFNSFHFLEMNLYLGAFGEKNSFKNLYNLGYINFLEEFERANSKKTSEKINSNQKENYNNSTLKEENKTSNEIEVKESKRGIKKINTISYTASKEIEKTLEEVGIFKNQFKDKVKIEPVVLNATLYDIKLYINEDLSVRPGFLKEENKITLPLFLTIINGTDRDIQDYYKYIGDLKKDGYVYTQDDFFQKISIPIIDENENDVLALSFYINRDLSINVEEILKLYNFSISSFPDKDKRFILNKLNEVLEMNCFKKALTREDVTKILFKVLNIRKNFLASIINYDYSKASNSILLYSDKNSNYDVQISIENSALLILFHVLGYDIVMFNPHGINITAETLNEDIFDIHVLEKIHEKLSLKEPKKSGFFEMFKNNFLK